MVLAKDEQIIKDWDYATGKSGKFFNKLHTQCNLTVTNKRIVYTAENERKITRQEMPMDLAKSVYGTHETVSKLGAFLLIIFGILVAVVGAILGLKIPIVGYAILAVAVIFGAYLVIKGIIRLNQGEFMAKVTSVELEGESLNLSASRLFAKKKPAAEMKIKLNNDIAREIVEELGAIVVEYRG
jgi:hypothetical protein